MTVMGITAAKVAVLVLLGLLQLASGLLPLLFRRLLKGQMRSWLKKLIGTVLCVGGGVLLSTIFIHMLKEVRELVSEASRLSMLPETDFPFAELLLCAGFLMILLVESVVHKLFGGSGHGHSHGIPIGEVSAVHLPRLPGDRGEENYGYDMETPSKPETRLKMSRNFLETKDTPRPYYSSQKETRETPRPFYSSQKDANSVFQASHPYPASHSTSDVLSLSSPPARPPASLQSSLRSFLTVVALSIHNLFEGLAIGLEESQAGVWQLFVAVALHGTAILFCVGVEMVTQGVDRLRLLGYMAVMSLVTPLGVGLGILVSVHGAGPEDGAQVLAVGVLQGLAAGTLLYITFYEVMAREKLARYGMGGLMGALAVLVGFSAMAAMEASLGHSHQHSASGESVKHGHHGHGHGEGVGGWGGQGGVAREVELLHQQFLARLNHSHRAGDGSLFYHDHHGGNEEHTHGPGRQEDGHGHKDHKDHDHEDHKDHGHDDHEEGHHNDHDDHDYDHSHDHGMERLPFLLNGQNEQEHDLHNKTDEDHDNHDHEGEHGEHDDHNHDDHGERNRNGTEKIL